MPVATMGVGWGGICGRSRSSSYYGDLPGNSGLYFAFLGLRSLS